METQKKIIFCIALATSLITSCKKNNNEEISTLPKPKAIIVYDQFIKTDTSNGSDFIAYLNTLSPDKADIAIKKYMSSLSKTSSPNPMQKGTATALSLNTKALASTVYTPQQISEFYEYGGTIYIYPTYGIPLSTYLQEYQNHDAIFTDPIQWTVAENAFGLWTVISKETVQYCNWPYPHFTGYQHNGSILQPGPIGVSNYVLGSYSENIIQSYPSSFTPVIPGFDSNLDQNIVVNVQGTYSCTMLASATVKDWVAISLVWQP